jgi:molybdenum cofactor cytidylyltransferase
VVATARVPSLKDVAINAGAAVADLVNDTPEMRTTIDVGLQWIENHWSPNPADSWLLIPADHPVLETRVIQGLMAAEQVNPRQSIFVPTYNRKRGHPTLVRWQHVSAIRGFPAGRGLNEFFRANAGQVVEVPVESPGILCDLDTPEDYARFLATNFE